MKNLLIICTLALCFTTYAQHPEHAKERGPRAMKEKMAKLTPEQRAALKTKKMTLDLDLSEGQQKAIQDLLLLEEKERAQLHRERKDDNKTTEKDFYTQAASKLDRAIEKKAALKEILNQEQFEKHEKIMQQKQKLRKRERVKKDR